MGLDVMYSKLQSANFGAGTVTGSGTPALIVNNRAPLVGGGTAIAEDHGQLVVPVPRPSRLLSLIA